jgi:hypothetical protein
MSSYPTKSADEIEAEIVMFAKRAVKLALRAMARDDEDLDAMAATEVYDIARDHAYDVLMTQVAGEVLVDILLGEVAEEATERLLRGDF